MGKYERKMIPMELLVAWTKNPRLPINASAPEGAMRAMLRSAADQDKIMKLARHISENGLDPGELMHVVEDADAGVFVVLDGNRRLTALKLLNDPSIAEGVVSEHVIGNLRKWKKAGTPISEVESVVWEDRDEALKWIELRHNGEQGGVGRVRWNPMSRERSLHDGGQFKPTIPLLEYVLANPELDAEVREKLEAGDFAYSTLARFAEDETARALLGFSIDDGELKRTRSDDEVLPVATHVVTAVVREDVNSRTVNTSKQIENWLRAEPLDLPGDTPAGASDGASGGPGKKDNTGTAKTSSKKKARARRRSRTTVIAKRCDIPMEGRTAELFDELRYLKTDGYVNVGALSIRSLVEWSLVVMEESGLFTAKPKKPGRRPTLSERMSALIQHLHANKLITPSQRKAFNRLVSVKNYESLWANEANALIHNPSVVPDEAAVRALWDQVEPLLEAGWKAVAEGGK